MSEESVLMILEAKVLECERACEELATSQNGAPGQKVVFHRFERFGQLAAAEAALAEARDARDAEEDRLRRPVV